MSRPATITDDRILEAARAEFLEHGIRATAARIARRAGISSGIMFHRFGSKQALFQAAMNVEGEPSLTTPIDLDLAARVGKGRVSDTLVDLGDVLLEKFLLVVPHRLMAWANPTHDGGAAKNARYDALTARGQALFAAYLMAEARLGRIHVSDPALVARSFGGALWHFAFEQVVRAKLGRVLPSTRAHRAFVRGLVDLLWSGMRPRSARSASRTRPRPAKGEAR